MIALNCGIVRAAFGEILCFTTSYALPWK